MIIDCISDLHGEFPKLDGGDLLIVAGDLTARDDYDGYCKFNEWMIVNSRKYKKSIVIAGNHDNGLLPGRFNVECLPKIAYLCDSETEFQGLKIWGSPWTAQFPGMNPHCMAFTMPFGCDNEEHLKDKWDLIPEDTDILITHSPPFGILDKTWKKRCGSKSLTKRISQLNNLKLHVFGHIHEGHGRECWINEKGDVVQFVNASMMDENYSCINKPITVIL